MYRGPSTNGVGHKIFLENATYGVSLALLILSLLQSFLNVVPLTSFLTSLKQYLSGWLQERDILSFSLVCPRPFPFSLSLKIKSKKVPQTAKSRFWFALDKNITLQSLNIILWNQSYAETHKKKT